MIVPYRPLKPELKHVIAISHIQHLRWRDRLKVFVGYNLDIRVAVFMRDRPGAFKTSPMTVVPTVTRDQDNEAKPATWLARALHEAGKQVWK